MPMEIKIFPEEFALRLEYSAELPPPDVAESMLIRREDFIRKVYGLKSTHIIHTPKEIETNLSLAVRKDVNDWRIVKIPFKNNNVIQYL